MKKAVLFLVMLTLALPFSVSAEVWKNVVVVDTMCSVKAKADPDKHTTQCALACSKGGFGILTQSAVHFSRLKLDQRCAVAIGTRP